MAISGTRPDPPPRRKTGSGASGCQTNQPPTGPRTSIWSPASATSVRYGETSPPDIDTTVSSIRSPSGADAIE